MERVERDEEREERIIMEIIVDANPDEQAMGWYYYLEEQLHTPFRAICISKQAKSPLRAGDQVEVIGMPSEEECEHGMFVTIRWQERELAVPLAQLEGVGIDEQTAEAIADWHYWIGRGYEL